jgi:ATP-dependent protease ClpP protease subunit
MRSPKKYKIDQIHDYNIDLKHNQIFLFSEEAYADDSENTSYQEPGVEYIMANRFIRNLSILANHSDKPILVHMKTCGGEWHEGMAIHDAIKTCPNKTTILAYAPARSMSSIIFQAATKRVMMKHTRFMFHLGDCGYEGTAKEFLTEAKELEVINEQLLNIYVESMQQKGKFKGQSEKEIKAWLNSQMDKKEAVYLSPEKTIEYGLADEIFDGDLAKLRRY